MKDVMLDLECFGNSPSKAAIVQIGAAYFDRTTGEVGETLKVNIDLQSAIDSGAEMEADTILWWMGQDPVALQSVIRSPHVGIFEAFNGLKDFLKDADFIWSHSTYDFVIVQETFKRLKIAPLSFRQGLDIRTLMNLSAHTVSPAGRKGVPHDALDDCLFQISYCVEAFKKLNGERLA